MNNAQRLALYERLARLKDGNDEARQRAANAYFPDEYRRAIARLPKRFREEYTAHECLGDYAIAQIRIDEARNVRMKLVSSDVDISCARMVDWLFLEFREVSRLRFRYNFPEEPIEKPTENADSVEKLFFECVPNDKKRLYMVLQMQSSGHLTFEFGSVKFRKEAGKYDEQG